MSSCRTCCQRSVRRVLFECPSSSCSLLLHSKEIRAFKGSGSLVSRQEQIITFTSVQAEIMLGITHSEAYSEFHYYHGTSFLWHRHQEIHLLPFGHRCDPKQQPSPWTACSPHGAGTSCSPCAAVFPLYVCKWNQTWGISSQHSRHATTSQNTNARAGLTHAWGVQLSAPGTSNRRANLEGQDSSLNLCLN